MATIWASIVSRPTFSARISKEPVWFTVPPITGSPGPFSLGMGSPVIIDSSTALFPPITAPSTGTLSPGRTRTRSPAVHLREGNLDFFAVPHDARRRRREVEELSDRPAGAALRAELQHLPHQHERDDDGRGLEVEPHLAVGPERLGEDLRKQHGHHAEAVGGPRADGDQCEHVQVPGDDRPPAPLEERPTRPQHDGGRQRELDPAARRLGQPAVNGNAQHRTHRDQEDGNGQRCGHPEPAAHVAQLGCRPPPRPRRRPSPPGPCRTSGTSPARRSRLPRTSGRSTRSKRAVSARAWQGAASA